MLANLNDRTVSVLLGNGAATFQPARHFAAGGSPYSVTVTDLNGDGTPDLATANLDNGTVGVLLGNGDGTFRPARTFAAGRSPRAVAVGDVNRDGVLDLLTANQSGSDVSILLGAGDGSFVPGPAYSVGVNPHSVILADLDGDRLPDLVVGGMLGTRVLLGNGDGTFRTTDHSFGTPVVNLVAGDFNGDGWDDVAGPYSVPDRVEVMFNTGVWRTAPGGGNAMGAFPDAVALLARKDRPGVQVFDSFLSTSS